MESGNKFPEQAEFIEDAVRVGRRFGLSAKDLGKQLDIKAPTFSKYRKGKNPMPEESRQLLASIVAELKKRTPRGVTVLEGVADQRTRDRVFAAGSPTGPLVFTVEKGPKLSVYRDGITGLEREQIAGVFDGLGRLGWDVTDPTTPNPSARSPSGKKRARASGGRG